MRFEITQSPSDNSYSYAIINEAGTSLFTSGSYPTREECTSSIEAAIQSLWVFDNYVVQGDGSIALTSDGVEIARSEPLPAGQNTQAFIDAAIEDTRSSDQFEVSITTTSQRAASQQNALRTLSEEELAALYVFARESSSGETGFELFQSETDNQHYFHFNDVDGQALLYSRGFSTAGQRAKRLNSVIQSASRENRFEIREHDGQSYFILKARNGQEIARSRTFASRDAALDGMSFVNQTAPSYADQYAKKKKRRDSSGTDDYLLAVPSPDITPGFVAFKNPDTKKHYFHLNDESGSPVLYSQGYSSGRGRDNGIRSVIKNSINGASFIPKEEKGTHYFALIAGNRQEIARSRSFETAASRDEMIAFLLTWIRRFAPDFSVSLDSITTSSRETFTLTGGNRDREDTGGTGAALGPAARLGSGDTQEGESKTEGAENKDALEETPSPADADPFSDDTVLLAGSMAEGDGSSEHISEPAAKSSTSEKAEDPEEEEEYAMAGGDRGGWLRIPWLIPLILLLILLIFLLRGCLGCTELPPQGLADNGDTSQGIVADNTLSEEGDQGVNMEGSGSAGAHTASKADSINTPNTSAVSGSTPTLLGPDASALGFGQGSLEGQIADLLSNADRALPASFVMDKVSFPSHSAKLNKSAYGQIDNLIALLKAYPDIVFEFVGHIDGTEDENVAREFMNGEDITLSAVRARCLFKKFEEQAISTSQLDFTGLGATKPLTDNTTEENRQTNRRLELVVKTK